MKQHAAAESRSIASLNKNPNRIWNGSALKATLAYSKQRCQCVKTLMPQSLPSLVHARTSLSVSALDCEPIATIFSPAATQLKQKQETPIFG
jgi:hypothetical protein